MDSSRASYLEKSMLDDLFLPGDSKSVESYFEFLKIFDTSCAHNLEKLSAAISASDFEQITGIAHNFKGTAGNVGASRLIEICKNMEASGKSKSIEGVHKLESDLRKEILAVRKALDDYGNSLAGRK